MKRVWMGAGLLAILLVAGLLIGTGMARRLAPGAEALRRAGNSAREGNWEQAETLTREAQQDWEKIKWMTAVLTGHEELEQIDDAFVQLTAYAGADANAYQALCGSIAQAMDAIGENHACTWQNFF